MQYQYPEVLMLTSAFNAGSPVNIQKGGASVEEGGHLGNMTVSYRDWE